MCINHVDIVLKIKLKLYVSKMKKKRNCIPEVWWFLICSAIKFFVPAWYSHFSRKNIPYTVWDYLGQVGSLNFRPCQGFIITDWLEVYTSRMGEVILTLDRLEVYTSTRSVIIYKNKTLYRSEVYTSNLSKIKITSPSLQ